MCRVVSPSGSITHLLVLNFGEVAHDLGGGIVDGHGLENGGSIVGDEERTRCGSDLLFTLRRGEYILNDFVHSLGTESGLDEIGNGSGSNEGVHACVCSLYHKREWKSGNLVDDGLVL